jgi:hypothetical protein
VGDDGKVADLLHGARRRRLAAQNRDYRMVAAGIRNPAGLVAGSPGRISLAWTRIARRHAPTTAAL